MKVEINGTSIYGISPDSNSRCYHYHKPHDIISMQFFCCGEYFCCFKCHNELSDHTARQWPENKFYQKAILCGSCGTQITIHEYLKSGYLCPYCNASFNPGCRNHYHLYFQQ
ncbi:hypothetical protein D7Z54_10420 [Salibacterium salarium]|uniref:CHY-type domain-containing protein n=1 Tax=Salibacterium salarium TaxID=284579 RepID=A0A3R9QM48_9BACI|nr:CHY zinc finger protein [Salibacterium salarium]RSL33378.1 hypothetical protein D7Z54_10420 [Salibacterium salarium]